MKSFIKFLNRLNHRNTQIIPKNSSKYLNYSFIIIAVLFVSLFAKQIFAFTMSMSDVNKKISDKQNAIGKGNNQEAWLDSSLISNTISLNSAIGGTIPDTALQGITGWVPQGLIGITTKAIASLYTPPASGVQYIAQTINGFLGKPAYADNGFAGLQGIMPIWKGFRNATYVVFSIIFVGIGIAIMLRVKISPQAVVTIQYALPKLITSLILVTFSYAIAGLLIDASYLIEGIVLQILTTANSGVGAALPEYSKIMDGGFSTTYWGLLLPLFPFPLITALTAALAGLIGIITSLVLTPGVGALVGVGTFVILELVILITLLVALFKFLFQICKCYLNLIIRIILGPFEIAMGAIPGSKMGFSSWLWQVIAYVCVFPITIIFLVLALMIVKAFSGDLWTPNMIGGWSFIFGPILGMTAVFLLPKLPNLILEFVFSIKPNNFGKAIGEGWKNNTFTGFYGGVGALGVGAGRQVVAGKATQNGLIGRGIDKFAARVGISKGALRSRLSKKIGG